MSAEREASHIKLKNVVDMALTFSAMVRVFEKGSKPKIVKRLEADLSQLAVVSLSTEYEALHSSFCRWFTGEINTTERKTSGAAIKVCAPASYGHAAKVFDIAVKVYVHYCHLPDTASAIRLLPLIHGAIDTPILNYLKKQYPDSGVSSKSIASIDKAGYGKLQILIKKHIDDEFKSEIYPAQFDDIMWHRLNRLV